MEPPARSGAELPAAETTRFSEAAQSPESAETFVPPFLAIGAVRFWSFIPGRSIFPGAPAGVSPVELPIELLKAGHRRGVFRARLASTPVVVKLSFHPLAAWKLQREWRRLEELRRRGIPAPGVVGGGPTSPGRWALVLEEIQGARGFDRLWREATARERREELLPRLAGALRDLHRAGIVHRDPHPANLLVNAAGFHWIDAGGIGAGPPGRPAAASRAIEHLAILHRALVAAPGLAPRDWLRALRSYARGELTAAERRAWARRIINVGAARSRRILRSRADRSLRTNRDFLQVREEGRHGVVLRSAIGESWTRFFRDPDSFFRSGSFLKDGRSTRAARIEWNGRPAFLKRYHRPSFFHRLKYCFRRSRAFRSFRMGNAFLGAGVPVPRPLAALDVRRGPWPIASYLVTEWAEGEMSRRFLPAKGTATASEEGLRLARRLGSILARAHSSGLCHRDLKPENIFFDPASGEVRLVDLDGARLLDRVSAKPRRRDLERWLLDVAVDSGIRQELESAYRESFSREILGCQN